MQFILKSNVTNENILRSILKLRFEGILAEKTNFRRACAQN